MRDKHNNDPRDAAGGGNLAANNPLMASEGSPWELYFRNQEVRDTIALDLERLHPGDEFYSSGDVQAALLDVLTVWSLENPSIGYRQGMHELAALVFSQRAADAAGLGHPWGSADAPPADPVVDGAPELSAAYVEHDAYAMFAALMGPTRADRPSAPDETTPVRMAAYFEDPPKRGAASEVQAACDRVFRTLGAVDKPLRDHLESLGIEPQLFLLRWLRVLFSREFHLHDALHVWDATFAANAADAADASYAFDSRASTRGGVRDFIEAFAVAMLLFVRADVLAQDDFAHCVRRLQKFPPVEDVGALVERARAIQPVVSVADGAAELGVGIIGTGAGPGTGPGTGNGTGSGTGSGPGTGIWTDASIRAGASSNGSNGAGAGAAQGHGPGTKAREILSKARDAGAAGRDKAGELFAKAAGAATTFVGHLVHGEGVPGGGHSGRGHAGASSTGSTFGGVGVAGGAGATSAAAALAATNFFAARGNVAEEDSTIAATTTTATTTAAATTATATAAAAAAAEETPTADATSGYEDVPLDDAPPSPPSPPPPAPPPPPPPASIPEPAPPAPPPAPAVRRTPRAPPKKASIFDDDDDEGLGLGIALSASKPAISISGGFVGAPASQRPAVASLFADDGADDPLFAPRAPAKDAASAPKNMLVADRGEKETARAKASLAGAASALEGVLASGAAGDAADEDIRDALAKLNAAMGKL